MFLLGFTGFGYAQEPTRDQLQQQLNNAVRSQIQLQGQGNLLAQQLQDYLEGYVDKKRDIQKSLDMLQQTVDKLQKKIADLDKSKETEKP